jgi:hypothetical protein
MCSVSAKVARHCLHGTEGAVLLRADNHAKELCAQQTERVPTWHAHTTTQFKGRVATRARVGSNPHRVQLVVVMMAAIRDRSTCSPTAASERKMRQWLTVVPSHLAPHGDVFLACSRRRRGSTRPQTVAHRLESRYQCHHSSKTQQRPRLICAASSRSLTVQSSQKRPSPCPTPKLAHWCQPHPLLCTTEEDEEG